ncbi:unnamed protein product [Anisakis simplex]|uniref:Trichohyalin n=1 Tax=Anisakis simplex TaxID=6269 RepID=A0A0M3JQV1_ANISI|nr:unnamed protein product [Anisakis simplex]
MRYGKIYFYDRMGNRVNDTRQETIKGFNSFHAPDFRPPSEDIATKTFLTRRNYGGETPPPEINERHRPLVTSPPLRGIYPIESPPPVDNTLESELLLAHLAPKSDELPRGDQIGERLTDEFPEDPILLNRVIEPEVLSKYDHLSGRKFNEFCNDIDSGAMKSVNYSVDGSRQYPQEEDQLCDRCKNEQNQMNTMNAEIERIKLENTQIQQLNNQCAYDITVKESEFHTEEERRKKALQAHIDAINRELMNEHQTRQQPTFNETSVLFGYDEERKPNRDDQLRYKEALDNQIVSERRRTIKERDEEIDEANRFNLAAANDLAKEREFRLAQEGHEREQLKKFQELQTQLKSQKQNISEEPWWVRRPDEYGWRERRLQAQNNQESLQRLEDFKRRLEQQDEQLRSEHKLRYDAIREKIHEQSALIMQRADQARGTIRPVNRTVVDAWKREWERNNERYRILQQGKTKAPSYIETIGMNRVKRCRRCSRPIGNL